jgi:hypothetical protein
MKKKEHEEKIWGFFGGFKNDHRLREVAGDFPEPFFLLFPSCPSCPSW